LGHDLFGKEKPMKGKGQRDNAISQGGLEKEI